MIFYFSTLEGSEVKQAGLDSESYHIWGHMLIYMLLVVALYRGIKRIVSAAGLSFLYGLSLEYYQSFIPGRAPQWFDVGVNGFGILISAIFLWRFYQNLPKILKTWLEV
ncbi:MAG: VanZ family protein [Patescibacteria group bacterium]